jgi:aminopeptidase N
VSRPNRNVTTAIDPERNRAFSGVYTQRGNFCTQCEPEGLRRITYFPDRPDVMARYSVTVRADKAGYTGVGVERQPGGNGQRGTHNPR